MRSVSKVPDELAMSTPQPVGDHRDLLVDVPAGAEKMTDRQASRERDQVAPIVYLEAVPRWLPSGTCFLRPLIGGWLALVPQALYLCPV